MYNPFPPLSAGLLTDQVARGKRYFVRQSFLRGKEGRLKSAFLLRAYPAEELEMARRHMAALTKDPAAFLYDAEDPEHLKRLTVAAGQPFGYKVFYAAKKGMDWTPPPVYKEKIRHYIRRHHPAWTLQRDGGKIEVGLFEEFGELFLKFSYWPKVGMEGDEGEEETIPFDVIENY